MKIFFLGRYNNTEFLTGPEKVAKRIFSEYTKVPESVFSEYFFDGSKSGIFKKLFGCEIIVSQNNRKVIRLGLFALLKLFFKERPDIIHIINYERFPLAAFVYRIFRKVKIVYNIHGIVVHENIFYRKVSKFYFIKDKICENIFLKYSDKLIFLSDDSVKLATSYYNFDKTRVEVFPNGIDGIFHLKGEENIDRSSEGKLKIVFTGNINRQEKGFNFLKNALERSEIPFEIYLTGSNEKFIKDKFSSVPLLDTNSFAEFLSDKDVFISASQYEPFSLAAVEAMAAGLVPIVTGQTGMSRYITEGINGFVFEFGDEKKLIGILDLISSDKLLLKEIQQRSKEIYSQLNWQKVLENYNLLYINIFNSKPQP